MKRKYNHAIIGCGRIAQNHYNAALENKMNISICCDLDINKAHDFAIKNNIPNYTNKYEDILNNENIDSVSICTDHRSHTKIAKKFLNKKNLIIEKPLSTKIKYAKQFARKSSKSSKLVTVISQHRFDEVVNLIKEMLNDDLFGKITMVNASLICNRSTEYYKDSYWRGNKKLEGGSTIINQSFHIVDTLNYLFGIPKSVKSFKKNYNFKNIINTEDTCISIMDYNSFLCTLVSTNTSNEEWKTSIKIIGTEGNIEFNIDFPEEILEINIQEQKKKLYKDKLDTIKKNYQLNLKNPVNYYGLSHIKQFKNFKNALDGNEKLKVTVTDSLSTQKFIDMIYRG